jgi:hypothetical protein
MASIIPTTLARLKGLDTIGRARLALCLVGALLVAYLVFASKPWSVHVAEGRVWKTSHFVTVYFWIAAAINLALVGLLALTAPRWVAPRSGKLPAPLTGPQSPKWFWPLVILAMAITAVTGWPRLGQGLWHDEAYPVRRAIVGHYEEQKDGTLKLNPVSWQDTLFYYKKPNHVLHSAVCRISNDTYRFFARPQGLQFSETALRLPTWLAGIASITALALLVRKLGFPSAAVIAAFLAALHPWHIRYATEARSYAFVLCLTPLVIYFLLQAIDRRSWPWWVAFAASQFALMYFYPTCVYVLAVLNLCAPLAIWWKSGTRSEALTLGTRWLVANIFAGMAFLQMMLPIVPQLIKYLKQTHGLGEVDYRWTQNFLAHLLSGLPWSYTLKYETEYLEIYPWAVNHPALFVFIVLVAVGAFALGFRRLLSAGRVSGLMVAPLILPAILCYVEIRAKSAHIYEWYILFLLPGVIALVALGLDELIAASRTRPGRMTSVTAIALLLVAYAAWTMPQRQRLMAAGMQTNRESVLLTRPTLDPFDSRQKNIITATFFGDPFPYDPNMVIFSGMKEFRELIERADAGQKPLFINLGYLVTVEGEHPNKYNFLRNSGLFEDLGILKGFEYLQSRHVFKYKPGSAAGFDFASLPKDPGSPGHEEKN